jgi:hypothetical protein
MRLAEVEGFEGVGRGLTHLIRLWKRVEKPKIRKRRVCPRFPKNPPLLRFCDLFFVALLRAVAETTGNLLLYQVAAKEGHYAEPRSTGESDEE